MTGSYFAICSGVASPGAVVDIEYHCRTMRFTVLLLVLPVLAADPAALILSGGRIWTGNPAQPWAEALAIRGERIVAAGKAAAVEAHRGPATEVIALNGRLAAPGFNDAHIHFLGGSLRLGEVDLTGVCTPETIRQAVAKWARENPRTPWITGGGWEYTCFPGGLPTRQMLDAAVADRPALIRAYDGHTSWANSKALEMAGVGKDTKYEGFGAIVRDPRTGEPTGALKEGAARLVARLLPPVTREQKLAALERGMRLAASLGITSIQNASGDREEIGLWEEIGRSGKQTLRVSVALSVGRGDCAAFRDLRGRHRSPMLRVDAVKFMLDGVIETHTAAMLDNYSDAPDTRGDLALPEAAYQAAVAQCDQDGWQVYTHAIGDRAVRVTLDAYTRVKRGRARIEHIETINARDIPRFAELGAMASMEPIHADPGTIEVWSRAVGPERLPNSFAWRALEKAGARLVFSSDWPASISVDPIRGLHNAVNRRTTAGKPAGGWIPAQRVSMETALRAYTAAGAYASFEEDQKGTLEPGKLADVVVLSRDLFRIPPEEIHTARVEVTVLGGRVVYRR
jgi:predicted amidohydrolase YtcJ